MDVWAGANPIPLPCGKVQSSLLEPTFVSLLEGAKMLDGFRSEVDGHVDTTAERIVQLGSVAVATSQAVVERTRLPAYPTGVTDEHLHLAALVER